jgi:flagellin
LTKKGQEKKMAVINTNVKALFSQMALKSSGLAQSTAMQQLSTGKRINSARDDAAGMAIATRMTHQIRSLNQAVRNAGDAISLIQTAEGATNEITDMMQRMRELSIQAVNDTNDNAQRSYLDLEFQQLKQQIVQISDNTEWNGFPLLSGKAGQQVGEMPVYKTTSTNQFGGVFIDPTTTRTIEGTGAGQQQKITFDHLPASGNGSIVLGGVKIDYSAGDTVDQGTFNARIKSQLDLSKEFGPGSGRSVSIETGATSGDTLVINFGASEGKVEDVTFSDVGLTGITVKTQTTTLSAVTQVKESFSNNGKFLKSGALTFDVPTSGTVVNAIFTTEKNETMKVVGELDPNSGTVTFDALASANSKVISDTLTYTLSDSAGSPFNGVGAMSLAQRPIKVSVNVAGSIPALRPGDLTINGVEIGGSYAKDDLLSPANNAAGSAIAKAAAINRMAAAASVSKGESQALTFSGNPIPGNLTVGGVQVTLTAAENTPVLAAAKIAAALKASPQFGMDSGRKITYAQGGAVINIDYPASEGDVPETNIQPGLTSLASVVDTTSNFTTSMPGTGVFAKVNENVFTGKAMSGSSVATGVVFINGYASANIQTSLNNPRETRINVVKAINLISDKTGVKAIDTGSDMQGISLVAADGRNIEVRFETDMNANIFGDRIGMREGAQSSTISLESKIDAPVVLGTTANGDITRSGLVEGNFTKNQSVYNTKPRDIVGPDVAQVSKVTITATTVGADEYHAVVNGKDYKYVATGSDTPQSIRDGLITAINFDTDVTATGGTTTGDLLITARVPGTPFTLSTSKILATGSVGSIDSVTVTDSQQANIKNLGQDDLMINGVKIRAATTADDLWSNTVSSSSNRSASAIALAAAINDSTPETGVKAVANPVEIHGARTETSNTSVTIDNITYTTHAPVGMQSLYINGVEIKVDFALDEPGVDRRAKVADAINERFGQTGVKATDNGKGIDLSSDGRNLSVWYDSNVEGLSPASFGLDQGGAVAQVSKIKIGGTVASGDKFTVNINGTDVQATATGTTSHQMALDMVAKINQEFASSNLVATIDPSDDSSVLLTSKIAGAPIELHGAAADTPDATLTLGTVTENSFGKNNITGIPDATSASASARTLYGTVRLISEAPVLPGLPGTNGLAPNLLGISGKPITVSTGADGFGAQSNFSALGFQVGGFGGRSSEDMAPPRVGRLAFQVGSSANQTVTIDLADFGKNGPITGGITGDVDMAVDNRTVRINTRDGATAVLNLLDEAMDKVNATRATMGAVMNRLDHVINNLTNVSMNMSASRSQIEDADYASASTELAKTQIMQQAATAVLAQANTSQQSVLKLLGG